MEKSEFVKMAKEKLGHAKEKAENSQPHMKFEEWKYFMGMKRAYEDIALTMFLETHDTGWYKLEEWIASI